MTVRLAVFVIGGAALFGWPAAAQVQASFIDGSYTMSPEACAKLKALAAGTPRNFGTVPWSVSAKGFDSGEGGCTFTKVEERKKGTQWALTARCSEHAPANPPPESYVFARTGPDKFLVRLTTPGTSRADAKPVAYTRCNVGAVAKPR